LSDEFGGRLLFGAGILPEETSVSEDGIADRQSGAFLVLLVNAARMLDGQLVSKLGLSDRLAEILFFMERTAYPRIAEDSVARSQPSASFLPGNARGQGTALGLRRFCR
jgi:hypothetical protein